MNRSLTTRKRQTIQGKVYGDIISNEDRLLCCCQLLGTEGSRTHWDNQRWIPQFRSCLAFNYTISQPSEGVPFPRGFPASTSSSPGRGAGVTRLPILLYIWDSSVLHWAKTCFPVTWCLWPYFTSPGPHTICVITLPYANFSDTWRESSCFPRVSFCCGDEVDGAL